MQEACCILSQCYIKGEHLWFDELVWSLVFCWNLQLLEMLMNNIGDAVHKLVIEAGLLPVLVKIVKKKVCTVMFNFSTSLDGDGEGDSRQ